MDVYVTPSEFSRQLFIQSGLPAGKIVMKPNFVHPDPGIGGGSGHSAVFVGRLAPEKGIATLLKAWHCLGGRIPLTIVGDGPLAPEVAEAASRLPKLQWVGWKGPEEVHALIGDAAFLVFPSEWYETFGRTAIEAYARGVPVVASRMGAMAELVRDGGTGLHFAPGDPEDLASKVEWAWSHPDELRNMGHEARAEFEAKYTADRNYETLMEIYARVLG